MKRIIMILMLFSVAAKLNSQTITSDKEIIQLVADNILNHTTYTIVDTENGRSFTSSANLPVDKKYAIGSP